MAKKSAHISNISADLAEIAPEQADLDTPRNARKSGKLPRGKTKKLTLTLTREQNFILEGLAGDKEEHKAAFALRQLLQGMAGHKAHAILQKAFADMRGQSAEAA